MNTHSESDRTGALAAFAAGVMIATHVGGRATRDGLFLSNFDIASLPLMFMVAAMFSLVTLLWASGAMARVGPGRLIPFAFAGSGLMLVGEWFLWVRSPQLASIVLYLHLAALGGFLISGFWSVINERFNPRTARKNVSLIASGGTLGGLVGGIIAERVAALGTVSTMLPLMGLMHLISALLVARFCARTRAPGLRLQHREHPGALEGVGIVAKNAYLRQIAILVLVTAGSATLLDYVFKARAFAVFDQQAELTRFFAVFYTATGLATFLLQTALGRRALETLGLAGTTATLPVATSLGSLAALFMPGLVPIGIVKGSEASVRSSLFRSGYELLYTPVALGEKRSAKSIIDVGVDRLADGLAAGAIFVLVLLPVAISLPAITVLALVLGIVALVVTRRLQRGYVDALKDRLVDRIEDEDGPTGVGTDSMLMQTIGNLDLNAVLGRAGAAESQRSPDSSVASEISQDPVVAAMADLRSGDRRRVRHRLKHDLDSVLAAQVISLLAWDSVSEGAVVALRGMGVKIVGELADALLDPRADFAVRRRIPRILAACDSPRAVAGLLQGLEDERFEVRFQSAAALSRIHDLDPGIAIPETHIQKIVSKELGVGPRGWTSRRLVDSDGPYLDDGLLEGRLDLSLTHVFRLLSLIFEKDPLRVALRGLHTDDPYLRGTALEYLENLLPTDIFSRLSGYLPEDGPLPATEAKPERDPHAELMLSRQSIEINLENLRKKPR